jgi:hypothetical protein
MSNRNPFTQNPWPRTESWWKSSDHFIPAPKHQWSRSLSQRLRGLKPRGSSDGWGRVTW